MHKSLLLLAEGPAAPRSSFALAAKGFRPFFLLASAFAVAAVPIWLMVLFRALELGVYFEPTYWHAHEMIFGFAGAVIAGFLLTAVGNWTQRETAAGPALLALCALWLAGRVVVPVAPALPRGMAAVVDCAFLPVLAVVLARPLVAAKDRRNFIMLGVLAGLSAANVAMHLGALGLAPGWQRRGSIAGVDVVVLVILVITGRVVPMFTRNATRVESIRAMPKLDVLAIAAMALLTIADTFAPDATPTRAAAGVVAVLAAARAWHWGARHTSREPLLWILHLGHAWIPIGLGLRALGAVVPSVPSSAATHALTAGAIGALTLGMMARVSLGHTGRMLRAPRSAVLAFVLVLLAALARVAAPIVAPAWYSTSLIVAGALWAAAFSLYLVGYTRILVSPRVDGKAG
jgi:uncharacterized protein involved in response to NO